MRVSEGEGSFVMSATRVRLRNALVLPAFAWSTVRTFRDAQRAEGNVLTMGRSDGWLVFWTLTGWTSEAALRAWVRSGLHAKVMKRTREWFGEATVVNWSVADRADADWSVAEKQMNGPARRAIV